MCQHFNLYSIIRDLSSRQTDRKHVTLLQVLRVVFCVSVLNISEFITHCRIKYSVYIYRLWGYFPAPLWPAFVATLREFILDFNFFYILKVKTSHALWFCLNYPFRRWLQVKIILVISFRQHISEWTVIATSREMIPALCTDLLNGFILFCLRTSMAFVCFCCKTWTFNTLFNIQKQF